MNEIIVTNEEFDDTKGVFRIRKFKKNRQHNGKKKVQNDKQRSTKHTHHTKDRITLNTNQSINDSIQ